MSIRQREGREQVMSTQQQRHEQRDAPRRRAPVWWVCAEHRTPPGQECRHCADQGELFTRAESGTRTYGRKR